MFSGAVGVMSSVFNRPATGRTQTNPPVIPVGSPGPFPTGIVCRQRLRRDYDIDGECVPRYSPEPRDEGYARIMALLNPDAPKLIPADQPLRLHCPDDLMCRWDIRMASETNEERVESISDDYGIWESK